MTTIKTILDFYKENENKYGQPLDPLKEKKEKLLKDAKARALAKLKNLGAKNEEIMFGILQALLLIPISMEFHKREAAYIRDITKKIKDKEIKLNKKIRSEVKRHYKRLPLNDLEAFCDITYKSLMSDKRLNLDADDLNELIREFENEKKEINWQGKTNLFFKDIIYKTFLISKEHSILSDSEIHKHIAVLLNCLNIKNTQGGIYTSNLIKPHCKTPSQ